MSTEQNTYYYLSMFCIHFTLEIQG